MLRLISEILHGNDRDELEGAWNSTEAADDFAPLPSGTYEARIVSGELTTAKTGTAGYKLTLKVLEGEHAGRLFWHDVWLTPAAMPMAKRDLGKLGISSLDQLDSPLPDGIRVSVKLVLRTDDDGDQYNRVKRFELIGIDKPQADTFAPADDETEREYDPDESAGDATFERDALEAAPEGGGE